LEGGFHRLTGLPITHDVVRLRTLALWLAAATLAGGIVWRLSESPVLGLTAFGLSFFHLERFCLEPGHPQELCAVLVLAAALLCCYLPCHSRRCWVPVGLGVLIGLVVMTKLNIGVFLATGMMLTLMLTAPTTTFWRLSGMAVMAGVILSPLAVTWPRLDNVDGWRLPIAVWAGIAGLAICRRTMLRLPGCGAPTPTKLAPHGDWPRRPLFTLISGMAVTCLTLTLLAAARGASAESLWYGLVGQHAGFSGPFYHPAPLEGVSILAALAGVRIAAWTRRSTAAAGLAVRAALAMLLLAVVWRYAAETTAPLLHGLNDRGGAGLLVSLATPLVWVILLPAADQNGEKRPKSPSCEFGRLALCSIAVLQPLGAFPVPGTQMAVGSLPLLLACLIAWGDFTRAWRARCAGLAPSAVHLALLLVLAAMLAYRGVHLTHYRHGLTPLALPGASRLRVPAETAQQQQWLVHELRRNAETFVFGEHAHNSVYLWTGLAPPTALNATVWPYLLRPEQQRRIVAALKGRTGVYVVREDYAAPPPAGEAPLRKYLQGHFRLKVRHGRWELWTAD
jgi:hypothetical protein